MKTPPDIHVKPEETKPARELDHDAERLQDFLRVVTTVPFALLNEANKARLARMADLLCTGGFDLEGL